MAPAPLLPGEKEEEFLQLAARIVGAAKPKDAIEEILIRDAIDLTWEIFRLRRIKAGVIKGSTSAGVRKLFDSLGHGEGEIYGYTTNLGQAWASGDKSARKEVEAGL